MTTLNAALNFNFASEQAARLAYAERGAEEIVAAQLRQAAAEQNPFKVGATVTARYQYKVAEDGSLVPTQTQITTEAPQDATRGGGRKGARQTFRQPADERQPSFRDFARVKPELSPADELSLFAGEAEAGAAPLQYQYNLPLPTALQLSRQAPASAILTTATAQASDEEGNEVEAQILTPEGEPLRVRNESLLGNIVARAQFAVAGLYARNGDVIYSVTPLAQFAA